MDEKLREAACFGDIEGLIMLLNKGADVNSANSMNGWTALHWAAKRNNVRVVETLLSRGADPIKETNKGELPAELSTHDSIRTLLQPKGAPIKDKTPEETAAIVPNYIRHPPVGYRVNVESPPVEERFGHVREKNRHVSTGGGNAVILKVRLAGSDDTDFIEVDVIPDEIAEFDDFVEILSRELEIDRNHVVRVRKLPDTRLRRMTEVKRFTAYQEIEVVTRK